MKIFIYKVWFKDGTFICNAAENMINSVILAKSERIKQKKESIIHQIQDENGEFYKIFSNTRFKQIKL